jgi:hypothetical protein
MLRGVPTGSIIGVADLFGYVKGIASKWTKKSDWHWLLRTVRPIRSVKMQRKAQALDTTACGDQEIAGLG